MSNTDFTTHLGLPYLLANQAQKHVTLNESLRSLDGMLHLSVRDREQVTPPENPVDGDRYLISGTASGDWVGHDGEVAFFVDGGWLFFVPQAGWRIWIEDEGAFLVFDGTGWISPPITDIQNLKSLGLGGVADANNPLLVKLNAALFTALEAGNGGNGNLYFKLNKDTTSDALSMLFQTGFSSRAEIGLLGDDDLVVKVSPDGAQFFESLRVDKETGRVSFPSGGVREFVFANRTYYVDPNAGSDANDGRSNATAFGSLAKATETVLGLDIGVSKITIQLADGTYNEPLRFNRRQIGGLDISVIGNVVTPGQVIIDSGGSNAVVLDAGCAVDLKGIRVQSSGNYGFQCAGYSSLNISGPVEFGYCHRGGFNLAGHSDVSISAAYAILDGAGNHIFMQDFSKFTFGGNTVTVSDGIDFANFIRMRQLAYCRYSPSIVLLGSVTGRRYSIETGSILNTTGGGASYLPGDEIGTAGSGAIYL